MKQFSCAIEEALFRLPAHRDRALNYKMEEVQITVVDELYVEQNAEGHVDKQIARVRLFFLGFLSGMYLRVRTLLLYVLCNNPYLLISKFIIEKNIFTIYAFS